MGSRSVLLLWVVPCLLAQSSAPSAGTASPETGTNPLLATVNGEPIRQRDFERIISALDPDMRQAALRQPREILEQYAAFQVLVADAEKAKLAEQTPFREQLAEARRQILVQGQLAEAAKSVTADPERLKKMYEDNKARYSEARAKVLFISQVSNESSLEGKPLSKREPAESKKLAEDLAAKLRGGEDFAKLAKQYSDDGSTADSGADYPDVIRGDSAGIPAEMRDAILAANEGDVVGPFQHQTGLYIFRVQSVKRKTLAEASEEILNELRQSRIQEKLKEARSRATIVMEKQD
ncbi:MAG TPA: peptidylprolyl isomerase [Bryobacteraceae bacterium]|nr:peptidylprolyl isomerase [Bryobacteraceae bacterium]